MFGMLQHGKQGRFSMAAAGQPRADFLGDDLPRTARKSEEADQTRQLLALAVILDGGSRREAARTGGVGLQVIRDGVLRFKAGGAEALVTRKAPAKTPILTDEHRTSLAATVEAGPKPDMDGIGRWVDPAQGAQEEPGVPVSRQTPGRDLRAIGFAMGGRHGVGQARRPPAARRGHRGVQQNVCDVVDRIRTQCGGKPIELRVQDDARMGQKNKRTRRRARRGTRPRARRTISGPKGPVSSAPSALPGPRATGRSCPGATLTPWLSLSSSSVNRSRPGHTPS